MEKYSKFACEGLSRDIIKKCHILKEKIHEGLIWLLNYTEPIIMIFGFFSDVFEFFRTIMIFWSKSKYLNFLELIQKKNQNCFPAKYENNSYQRVVICLSNIKLFDYYGII